MDIWSVSLSAKQYKRVDEIGERYCLNHAITFNLLLCLISENENPIWSANRDFFGTVLAHV